MRYCKKCVMPETKPGLYFDEEGICSACRNYEHRVDVDWDSRKKELAEMAKKIKNKNETSWDCIVPVSGGKDSTYQVIKMLELGLNPLCVTATTCDLSDIGRKNIENLKNIGVDYIEFTTNRVVRKKLNKIGLLKVGDISWPEHVSIFTIPMQVAVKYKIPLIVWGENSGDENGAGEGVDKSFVLDKAWLDSFGTFMGIDTIDLIGVDGLSRRDLLPFIYPSQEEIDSVGVKGIFLGSYIPWDGAGNAVFAQGYGLTTYDKVVEGSLVNYENLDNYQMRIHDYFKYLKFGYSRPSDWASLYIRRGRLERDDAINLLKLHEGKFPWVYLGKKLEDILHPLDISIEDFVCLCDKYTNSNLFEFNGDKPVRDKNFNLIPRFDIQ